MEIDIVEILICTPIAIILLITGLIITKSKKAKVDNNYTNYGCLGLMCIIGGIFSLFPLILLAFAILSSVLKLVSIIIILFFIIGLFFSGIYVIIKKIKGE